MKKVLLTFFMVVTAFVAMAQTKEYKDQLVVSINGEAEAPVETTIIVDKNSDGTYKLALNKFCLGEMKVGNIVVDNITVNENNGIKTFETSQEINVTPGDENVDEWMAMEGLPVTLKGKMNDEVLYCTIAINLGEDLIINVVFGNEDNVTTGIENVAVENAKVIYDITGREVKEITNAGIYIVNGKKVFVK